MRAESDVQARLGLSVDIEDEDRLRGGRVELQFLVPLPGDGGRHAADFPEGRAVALLGPGVDLGDGAPDDGGHVLDGES